ncbi:outer membrane protein [Novosphingobium colocasiae]
MDGGRATHFDGPYVQIFGGLQMNAGDRDDTLVFDTTNDGKYDDQVTTIADVDAFGPGFCNGAANGATPAAGCRADKDKAEYGARIGYDRRMGNFVFGGLIEGTKGGARDATSGFSTTPASYTVQRKMDYSASARLRAGYTPNGGALFYVTGGGSYARIDHDFATTNMANDFTPQGDKKGVWGWQAGGGAEIMLTDSVSLGMEYLYNRYNDKNYRVLVTQGTAPATNPFLLDSGSTRLKGSNNRFDYHSVRATLGFQF